MIFFLDTEFNERPGLLELISIGIVSETKSYYAVSSEFSEANCNDWVRSNVLPHLDLDGIPTARKSLAVIREELIEFLGEHPILWTDYGAYDWVVFCWIFGPMIDLPKTYPMYPRELNQLLEFMGLPRSVLPDVKSLHNALDDARDLMSHYYTLQGGTY